LIKRAAVVDIGVVKRNLAIIVAIGVTEAVGDDNDRVRWANAGCKGSCQRDANPKMPNR
jgi:hypothetical protein